MSTTPSPPESDNASSTPDASPTKRPWTILGRLSKAVREQNWFAVVLELAIVVVGVVIGFQVTGWGQARSDHAKEQTYLRQLVVDLAETERLAEDNRQKMVPRERAPRRLAQAHFLPEPPPRDSVIAWANAVPAYSDMSPVLGTAEALVSTGDIGLIRDDSLRSAIVAYLDQARENVRGWDAWKEFLQQRTNDFGERAPLALIFAEAFGPTALDSLDRADNWMVLVPPGVPLPAFDTDAFVRDEQIHRLMVLIAGAKDNLAINRREMAEDATALREQVEAELNR